jgi:hypothetical protein
MWPEERGFASSSFEHQMKLFTTKPHLSLSFHDGTLLFLQCFINLIKITQLFGLTTYKERMFKYVEIIAIWFTFIFN